MPIPTSLTQVLVTLVLIVPGFMFQAVRIRLRGRRTPAESDLATRVLSAFTMSMAFALVYVVAGGKKILGPAHEPVSALAHPRLYAAGGIAAAFVVPALLAAVAAYLDDAVWWQSARLKLLPSSLTKSDSRPAAWDVAFQDLPECYIRVKTADGKWYAGWYGEGSYASSWPDPRSLFLATSYHVDDAGELGLPVEGSLGVMIDCTDAVLVELLAPSSESDSSGTMDATEVSL